MRDNILNLFSYGYCSNGGFVNVGNEVQGTIDNLFLFNRKISDSEVNALGSNRFICGGYAATDSLGKFFLKK
jgi:hypothetical protein